MMERLEKLLEKVSGGTGTMPAIEALLDAHSTPSLVTDSDDRVVLANAPACALLGLPSREVVGRPLSLLLQEHNETAESKIEETARPIRAPSGSIAGHFNVLTKSQLDHSSSELETLHWRVSELEQENEALRAFEITRNNILSNVSHELRTPLVTIIGYVEMIAASDLGKIPEEAAKSLKVVLRNALRLSSKIDDLLNLSRLQEEELKPHLESVSIQEVISALLSEYHLLIDDKSLEIEARFAEDLPPVWADRRLTSLALENLLKNAIKFSPLKGLIQLSAKANDGMLRITIEDEGAGIPSEHLANVFNPFFQVDGSPTRLFGGIGLGLPIVRRIAEAHQGRASLESNGKHGTTAILELPLVAKQ